MLFLLINKNKLFYKSDYTKVKRVVCRMDKGFLKGQSDNLPRVDSLMVAQYFMKNQDFTAAEIHGIKMKRYVCSK